MTPRTNSRKAGTGLLKTRCALAGILAVLAALLVSAGYAQAAHASSRIPDIPTGHPYSDALYDLASRGILSGYADGTFDPAGLVTRQQFAKMMVLTMGLPVTEEDFCSFTDVPHDPSSLYPYHYVAVASRYGFIKGYGDGTFRGGGFITRAQAITMVVRAAASVLPGLTERRDEGVGGVLDHSDPWHGENIRTAEVEGLLAGIQDLPAWPTAGSATRGETAQLLRALLIKMGARPRLSVFTYGALGDGATDDGGAVQAAIDAASASGGEVYLPEGEYVVGSTVGLRTGVAVIGIPGKTIVRMPAGSSAAYMFAGTGVRNVAVEGLTLRADSLSDDIWGIYLVGSEDSRLSGLRFERLWIAMKLGTGPPGTRLTVEDIVARECESGIFVANLSDSTFARLDLEVNYEPDAPSGSKHHIIYIERGARDLSFREVVMNGSDSWPLHLYNHSAQPSGDLLFDGLSITTKVGPIIVSGDFERVTFRDFKAAGRATDAEFPAIDLQGCRDVLAEDFEVWGGIALVAGTGTSNVVFRNGVYHGPRLVSPHRKGSGFGGPTVEPSVVLDTGGAFPAP